MERNLELKDACREMRGALIGERFGETASHVARAVHSTAFPLSPLISQIKSSDRSSEPTIAKLTGVQEANYRSGFLTMSSSSPSSVRTLVLVHRSCI